MIIACENCHKKFKLDASRISKAGSRVKCSQCRHVFTAYRPAANNRSAHSPEAEFQIPSQPPKGAAPPFPAQYEKHERSGKKKSRSCKIISVSNQKGGVAKTSTCLNLGNALSLSMKRVLLIDFDVQSNLTISLGYRNTRSFYDAFHSNIDLSELIIKTKFPGLFLLPSSRDMVLLNKKLFGSKDYEFILKNQLDSIKSQYDYILIDTPPSIDFFTINALTAADLVIVPCLCEYLSMHGVNQIINFIHMVKNKTNPVVDYKILVNMFDSRNAVATLMQSKLKNTYRGKTFGTAIDFDNAVKESQIVNIPVIQYNKESCAGRQYLNLAREVMQS